MIILHDKDKHKAREICLDLHQILQDIHFLSSKLHKQLEEVLEKSEYLHYHSEKIEKLDIKF